MMDLTILALPAAGALRNVAGWLENALEDGKITPYEWAELGKTVLKVGVIGLAVYLGLDYTAVESGSIALIADIVLKKVAVDGKKP